MEVTPIASSKGTLMVGIYVRSIHWMDDGINHPDALKLMSTPVLTILIRPGSVHTLDPGSIPECLLIPNQILRVGRIVAWGHN